MKPILWTESISCRTGFVEGPWECCSPAENTVWRYRKHSAHLKQLISWFECELNVCSGQSLHKRNAEARRMSDMQVHASAGILIFPQRARLWLGLKDEPLHISLVMNINDPRDLLKLHIKGHITRLKNKLYTLSLKMAPAEWDQSGSRVLPRLRKDRGGNGDQ